MATLDEVISQMSEEDYYNDPIQFVIDSDLRVISIPGKGVVAGVVGDKNINRINFQMSRYYNGFDMSKFTTRVNYINARGNFNYYSVTDLTIEDDLIYFTWLVDSDVVEYAGIVMFAVNMFITDSNGKIIQSFNTSNKGLLNVLEGIQVNEYVTPEEQEDILTRLEADLTKYISSGINQIQDEGSKVKKSLPADYVKMTEDVTSLKTNLRQLSDLSLGFGKDGLMYIFLSGKAIGNGVEVNGTVVPSNGVAVFVADFSDTSPSSEQFYSWEGRDYNGAITDSLSNIQCDVGVAKLTSVYDTEKSKWIKQMMCTGGLFESDNFICEFEAKFCGLAGSWNNVITYGTGTHWTNEMYSKGIKWPAGGEIDAFEQAGGYSATPNTMNTPTVHWGSGTASGYPDTHLKRNTNLVDFTTDKWHKFKFQLINGYVKVWIDDVLVGENDFSDCTVDNNYLCNYKPFLKPQAFYIDGSCASNSNEIDTNNVYEFYVKNFNVYQDAQVECTELEIYPQMWEKETELVFPVGAEIYLDRAYTPSNTSNKACTWESSNPAVATVVQGFVKTLTEGSAMITAKCGTATAQYIVNVSANANVPCVKVIAANEKVSLVKGKTYDVTSYAYPRFATDDLVYVSNDKQIATFENGIVKGVGKGQTEVIITCGTKSATISVDVLEGATPVIAYDLSGIVYDGEAYTGETSVIANTGSYGSSFDGTLSQSMTNYYNGNYSVDGYVQKATLDANVTGLNLKGVAHTVIYKGVKIVNKPLGAGSTDIKLRALFDSNGNVMPSIQVSSNSIKYGNVTAYTYTFTEEISNIAVSSDGTTAKLFINGEMVASGSDGYSASNPTSFKIDYINENIESFEIYMEQLSDEELIGITSVN